MSQRPFLLLVIACAAVGVLAGQCIKASRAAPALTACHTDLECRLYEESIQLERARKVRAI